MFLEPYHAPYIFHHRYWTGLLLFIRAILYIVSAANVSNDPGVNLLAIAIAVVGLLITSGYAKNKVYRRWPLNLLEVSCYVNLLCFCLAKLFTLTENSDGITIAYISGSFTVVSFTTVLVYHVYTELFSQTIKRLWKILKQGNQEFASVRFLEAEINTVTDHDENQPTHSEVSMSALIECDELGAQSVHDISCSSQYNEVFSESDCTAAYHPMK